MWCWLYQFRMSQCLDERRPLPAKVERHTVTCRRCSLFRQRAIWMDGSFGARAALRQRPLPDHVHEAILACVSETQQREAGTPQWRFSLAVAACLALMGVGGIMVAVLNKPRHPAADYAQAVAEVRDALRSGGILVSGSTPSGRPAALQEAIESPFATELHALTEDTRSAARFLVACAAMDVPATTAAGPGGR
jgi:hypothetical protein